MAKRNSPQTPKDETPKDETPKDETPKDETPKDETPKEPLHAHVLVTPQLAAALFGQQPTAADA